MLDKIRESSKYLAPFVKGEHTIGIILGTGLGELGKSIEIEHAIPYMTIPNFPVSTVQGHRGELLIGSFGGKKVIAMQGRFHYYEGYSMKEVTFPVRVMHALGVKTLFVSNAAGGVNTNYLVGDLMIIRDHINLFPEHPLRGKNIDELGPRFPGMAEAYSKRLIQLAEEAGKKLNIPLQKACTPDCKGHPSKHQQSITGFGLSVETQWECPPCRKSSLPATWTWNVSGCRLSRTARPARNS